MRLNRLKFDELSHSYYLDDIKIPCVSDILEAGRLVDFLGVNFAAMCKAQEFGIVVHKACQLWGLKILGEQALAHPHRAFLAGGQTFCWDFTLEFKRIETDERVFAEAQ